MPITPMDPVSTSYAAQYAAPAQAPAEPPPASASANADETGQNAYGGSFDVRA